MPTAQCTNNSILIASSGPQWHLGATSSSSTAFLFFACNLQAMNNGGHNILAVKIKLLQNLSCHLGHNTCLCLRAKMRWTFGTSIAYKLIFDFNITTHKIAQWVFHSRNACLLSPLPGQERVHAESSTSSSTFICLEMWCEKQCFIVWEGKSLGICMHVLTFTAKALAFIGLLPIRRRAESKFSQNLYVSPEARRRLAWSCTPCDCTEGVPTARSSFKACSNL